MRVVWFTSLTLAAAIAASSSAFAVTLEGGAVAAPDQYGAEVAAQILKKGGNAVDAAVATAFTLAVTYPEAGNIGGGGFMTLFIDGKPYFLDYRETAPKAASRDMYLDDKGEIIENMSCRCAGHGDGLVGSAPAFRQIAVVRVADPRRGVREKWLQGCGQAIPIPRGCVEAVQRHHQLRGLFRQHEAG